MATTCSLNCSLDIDTLWLIPSDELGKVAPATEEKFISVACSNPASNDRFTPYRMRSMSEAVARIFAREAQSELPDHCEEFPDRRQRIP